MWDSITNIKKFCRHKMQFINSVDFYVLLVESNMDVSETVTHNLNCRGINGKICIHVSSAHDQKGLFISFFVCSNYYVFQWHG